MNTRIANLKCTHVLAQVSLGYYDEEGNLIGEEAFPQSDGNVLTAKLFYPHAEQLENLIGICVELAWAKLNASAEGAASALRGGLGEPGGDGSTNGTKAEKAQREA
jgi:hypothetical protein